MRVISVNVGLPRQVAWRGKTTRTSIFKTAVPGRVRVDRLNLAGDRQSDLRVHGGPDKAVYVYPAENYAFWKAELPGFDLPWGIFGENLTTEGLSEKGVAVGDRLEIGSAEFVVTQPRMPCSKLGMRFDRANFPKRFLESRRTGFYLRVLREGDIGAGDPIRRTAHDTEGMSIQQLVELYAADPPRSDLLHRALSIADLSAAWRETFRKRLAQP